MAYGAPDTPADIAPFYTDIRRGRAPSAEALAELTARYAAIGGASPLLAITRRQAAGLAAALGPDWRVYVGMRHWTPWIHETVAQMARDGITEAVALVLAPHDSRLSVGAYMEKLEAAVAAQPVPITFRKVRCWHRQPELIAALAQHTHTAQQKFASGAGARAHVLFTAHSLPERIREWNDPYPHQLEETAQLVADARALPKWSVAYQSAGRTPEPWLGPDILSALAQLAQRGEKQVLVCVIGFVADHLEVLYDLDVEAKTEAGRLGIQLERIAMLNDTPGLVATLAAVVRNQQ